MGIVDDLRDLNSMHTPKEISDIGEKAADEIERLREEVEHLHKMTVKWSALQVEGSQEIQRLRKENEQLRSQMDLFDPSTTQEMAAAALNFANDEIKRLQERNHALRERVELLEGYLNGALTLVENFAHCDTTDARKALEGK